MIRLPAERARDALLRAMEPIAAPFAMIAATSEDWASGLFYGARHRLAIRIEGDDQGARAMRLQAELPEIDLPMRRGFVADIQVSRLDGTASILAIEALTIDEASEINRAARRAG